MSPDTLILVMEPHVTRLARSMARQARADWSRCDDLRQIGLIAVWQRAGRFAESRGAKLQTFLLACARNAMRDEQRLWRRWDRTEQTGTILDVPERCGPVDPIREFVAYLTDAGVPPDEIEFLTARYGRDESLKEVGTAYNRGKFWAFQREHKIRDRLRGGLECRQTVLTKTV